MNWAKDHKFEIILQLQVADKRNPKLFQCLNMRVSVLAAAQQVHLCLFITGNAL